MKRTEDQKKNLVSGKNKGFPEDNVSLSSFYPTLQTGDFLKSNNFLKDPNRPKSKSSDLDNYQADVYGLSSSPTIDN